MKERFRMRVITGSARGRTLLAPAGLDTRPTSDLVKEAVFSIIQFEIEGADVLDLFAGSGQMGIEALSRGARHCVLVDSSRACQQAQARNLAQTGLSDRARAVRADAFSFLRAAPGPFDIAFLDPPYGQGALGKILPLTADVMRPGGVILCETSAKDPPPPEAGAFERKKVYRYGKTIITLYRESIDSDSDFKE